MASVRCSCSFLASVAATWADDGEAAVAIAQLAQGLAVDTPIGRMLVALLTGLGAHFEGDFAAAAPPLRLAVSLAKQLDDDYYDRGARGAPVRRAGRALPWRRSGLLPHQPRGDSSGAHCRPACHPDADPSPGGLAELWEGRWASASANLSEGLRIAREIGQHDLVAYHLVLLALIAAHRGDEDECRSLAGESLELSSARRFVFATESAHWALTVLELGLGRPEEALPHARAISNSGIGLWAMLDRIEAAVHAGEREAARDWLAYFEPWAENGGAAWARAVLLHCRGLLSDDERECERLLRASLDAHAKATRPFERSRTELALGELLRRARRRVEAREHLRAALNGFEELGARLWAERARMELRASGQVARRRDPSTRDELTAQELQIVHLVAQGLSNREVAAQLFLSSRTIDFHLRNVFRKLNISSRTQLARLDLDGPGEQTMPARETGDSVGASLDIPPTVAAVAGGCHQHAQYQSGVKRSGHLRPIAPLSRRRYGAPIGLLHGPFPGRAQLQATRAVQRSPGRIETSASVVWPGIKHRHCRAGDVGSLAEERDRRQKGTPRHSLALREPADRTMSTDPWTCPTSSAPGVSLRVFTEREGEGS